MADGAIAIERVNPLEVAEWDSLVAGCAGATFFHTAAWARVLTKAYGYTPLYLTARAQQQIVAVLPLMEVESWCTGRRGVSLPFTDRCGAIGDVRVAPALFSAALDEAKARRWRYCEVRDGCSALRATASTTFHIHTLQLAGSTDSLWERLDDSVRRSIRKAEREGIQIEVSRSVDGLRAFYALVCRTRHRQGVPPQPWRFFEQLQVQVLNPGHGHVLLARLGDAVVAGALLLQFGSTGIFKFGASDERMLHARPNHLLMWEAIQWHAQHGYDWLDFGRTSLANEGLRRFKRSWGTDEGTIAYARYDCRRGDFVQAPDLATGWHTTLFQHLPMPLSRAFGALAYRHVA